MTQKSANDRFSVGFSSASLAAVTLIWLGSLAAPAVAGEISVDNVQLPYSETVNLNGVIDGSSYSDNGQLAGQIVLTVNNGSIASATGQYSLPVWCVDIFHDISLGSSGFQFSEGVLSSDNDSSNASALSTTQISDILALATYGNQLMQNNPTNQTSAEVQAAIWTVEYNNANNSLAVTGGDFTAADVTNLIADAAAAGGGGGQLISLNGIQQQVFDSPVPEPASLGLLAVSLFGIGFARRRKG